MEGEIQINEPPSQTFVFFVQQSLVYFNLQHFAIAPSYRFFNLKKDFEHGRTTAVSARPGRYRRSKAFLSAKTWFQKFVKTMADSMPNEQKKHLPSCLTKEKVYKMYEEEMKNLCKDGKRLGYSRFRKMWRANFQDVIIPKVCVNCYRCTIKKVSKKSSSV